LKSVDADGNIRTYRLEEYNLDQINEGKLLFVLYETSGDERYKKAIHLLRKQLQTQPRTGEGGFWHKRIYRHQMWLDGIYMAKGIRKGYLDHAYLGAAHRGYDGILGQFVSSDDAGMVNLGGICSVGGLGGEPYRDGLFEDYISEPVVSNEHKGVGAFILASVEMERLEQL
jgi:rhamnogalacturonyl hydrolase YesR